MTARFPLHTGSTIEIKDTTYTVEVIDFVDYPKYGAESNVATVFLRRPRGTVQYKTVINRSGVASQPTRTGIKYTSIERAPSQWAGVFNQLVYLHDGDRYWIRYLLQWYETTQLLTGKDKTWTIGELSLVKTRAFLPSDAPTGRTVMGFSKYDVRLIAYVANLYDLQDNHQSDIGKSTRLLKQFATVDGVPDIQPDLVDLTLKEDHRTRLLAALHNIYPDDSLNLSVVYDWWASLNDDKELIGWSFEVNSGPTGQLVAKGFLGITFEEALDTLGKLYIKKQLSPTPAVAALSEQFSRRELVQIAQAATIARLGDRPDGYTDHFWEKTRAQFLAIAEKADHLRLDHEPVALFTDEEVELLNDILESEHNSLEHGSAAGYEHDEALADLLASIGYKVATLPRSGLYLSVGDLLLIERALTALWASTGQTASRSHNPATYEDRLQQILALADRIEDHRRQRGSKD